MSKNRLLLATEIPHYLPHRDTSGHVKKSFSGHVKVPLAIFIYHIFIMVNNISHYVILRVIPYLDRTQEPARGSATYDKLYKVREFHDLLATKHQPLYNIGPQIAIEEAMISVKYFTWIYVYFSVYE